MKKLFSIVFSLAAAFTTATAQSFDFFYYLILHLLMFFLFMKDLLIK